MPAIAPRWRLYEGSALHGVRFALGFMVVAACGTDGIARISLLGHVGDKRLPALIRRLMTEGEARPNGCTCNACSLPLMVKPIPPCRTSFRLGR